MKLVLDVEVPCPVSGMMIRGIKVPYHTLPLQALDNKTLMIFCPNHLVRGFIGDRTTTTAIIDQARVVHRIEKFKKKEADHGTTP